MKSADRSVVAKCMYVFHNERPYFFRSTDAQISERITKTVGERLTSRQIWRHDKGNVSETVDVVGIRGFINRVLWSDASMVKRKQYRMFHLHARSYLIWKSLSLLSWIDAWFIDVWLSVLPILRGYTKIFQGSNELLKSILLGEASSESSQYFSANLNFLEAV